MNANVNPMGHMAKGNIGQQLLDSGKISASQAEKVLLLQKETGMRFGEAAIKLGLITEQDIQDVLAQQFEYPYLVSGQSRFSEKLLAAYSPFDPQVEALRSLRSQILLRWVEGGNKSVALTSYDADEQSELLAANLAVVFSQLGERTLLVDANLRNPKQHEYFAVDNRKGLSDVLAGRSQLDAVHRISEFRDLSILTAGTKAPNPQELLSRDVFSDAVAQLAQEYDVVIYSTSPLQLSVDAQLVASRVKGSILVASRNQTPIKGLETAKEQLQSANSTILGCVIAQDI
ncbi:chain length determinant protein tyrosine kinase EpsG [Chitinibacter fontanus]|uniref:Chain length determinant protein tyrosine kinase EpsG n=1 Tax=Chitinibacter fontanus TaxID=1737446 RepID=A0A7D5ZIS3_9NEIS|nr:chain length determinant protein tyrosine kinase EpsG [Chitinibacter fontanus]QLI82547.1 chain length determinant protein tyrosine kinase EpsG [Chitinibacter fontanus]